MVRTSRAYNRALCARSARSRKQQSEAAQRTDGDLQQRQRTRDEQPGAGIRESLPAQGFAMRLRRAGQTEWFVPGAVQVDTNRSGSRRSQAGSIFSAEGMRSRRCSGLERFGGGGRNFGGFGGWESTKMSSPKVSTVDVRVAGRAQGAVAGIRAAGIAVGIIGNGGWRKTMTEILTL